MLRTIIAGLALGASAATDAGLVDNPIVTSAVTYLDGSDWRATASGGGVPVPGPCVYEDGKDWGSKTSHTSGVGHPSASKEECCAICGKDASCVASVYNPSGDKSRPCWTKTAADAAGGQYDHKGVTSCKPSGAPAPAPPGPAAGLSIGASVPGDLLTDLQRAGQIGDPLYEKNFLNSSLWNDYTWTYKTTFAVPAAAAAAAGGGASSRLVFDGIKMGATIKLDGATLGVAADQFLRYEFDITAAAAAAAAAGAASHTLEVVFEPKIDVGGRFMACTGGWDWAPYTNTFATDGTTHTFSKGLWKSVYVASTAGAAEAAITHVVPQITYQGAYPTAPLTDATAGAFQVAARVFVDGGATGGKQDVTLTGDWGASTTATLHVPPGRSNFTLTVPAFRGDVKLWWPVGMGAQPLYNLTVTVGSNSASRRVGFRYFALVTGNDTDPAYVANATGAEGTSDHGMYFRVNGAVMWSKGANMIPMEELEGRMSGAAHRRLVQSAADGGMNTLRVWGGGMFLPDAWYDACDELGIIVYHDMQYAQEGHAPDTTANQEAELRHAVRRLSSHVSIVVWDGCNECRVKMGTPTGIYATFVMTVVAEEDKSRAIWPSCPALGWTTGVRRLDSIPTGSALTTPDGGKSIETHGPYQHGTGFPAVNGASGEQPFGANIPINVSQHQTGPGFDNVFASEFGAVVMSSFESMAPTLDPAHWGLHAGQPDDTCTGGFAHTCTGANVMAERNYPCDSLINVYFGHRDARYYNTTGEAAFKTQLYQCMLSQALNMKSNIETRRAQNQLGCIVWQYNEIWPTGGWGSIEYGTVGHTKGQVIGGRWKPLQYWYKRSIYADVMATCGAGGSCFVKNDQGGLPFKGTCEVAAVDFATATPASLKKLELDMAPGAGVTQYFNVDISSLNGTTHFLTATCADAKGATVSRNEIALATPGAMAVPAATVAVASVGAAPEADGSIAITLSASAPAMYVTLTTLAQGRFSDNSFAVPQGETKLSFIPFGAPDVDTLKSSLRVEHLAGNQK